MTEDRCMEVAGCFILVAFVLTPLFFVLAQVDKDDICTYQDHEIGLRDLGVANNYLEVNKSFCAMHGLRLPPWYPANGTRQSHTEDLRQLKKNNCIYTSKRYNEVVYMRCSDSLLVTNVGTLYITGSGNVFCGVIEFDLTITGHNNSVYRVVAC